MPNVDQIAQEADIIVNGLNIASKGFIKNNLQNV